MSPGPNPCAPPLNLVPNGSSGIPLPLLSPDDYIPNPFPAPTYTDLVTQLLDDLATDADGFDGVVADASALVDQWDAAAAAQDTDLDTILTIMEATDTSGADNAGNAFESAFATGDQLVAGVQGVTLPDYGQLPTSWVQPGAQPVGPGGVGPSAGTVTAGSPAFTSQFELGFPVSSLYGAPDHAQLLASSAPVFTGASMVTAVLNAEGNGYDVTVAVNINPTTAGTFQGTVAIYGRSSALPVVNPIYITIQPAPAAGS
jgi:hypothetical protein